MTETIHVPVMMSESIESLDLKSGDIVVDCTVNHAGHASVIADRIGKSGTLIINDLDKNALKFSLAKLSKSGSAPTIIPLHDNYRNIKQNLAALGIAEVQKIFADLGLSSDELERSGRGFTFQKVEPLLMTFQSEVGTDTFTARDLLHNLSTKQLEDIFKNYGDETRAKKIAMEIVKAREAGVQIETTKDLVDIITKVSPYKPWQKTHPATKVFQALRIAVNDEYDGIKELITSTLELLSVGGILSIITFHSGEDRIVKNEFNNLKAEGLIKIIPKQKPSAEEIKSNRRSRSAILRTFQKL
jgi:16S rRNA (cytosine1402-N4)-methyltransferase